MTLHDVNRSGASPEFSPEFSPGFIMAAPKSGLTATAGARHPNRGGDRMCENPADDVDPVVEHGFWLSTYYSRPYVKDGVPYEEYAPAYQYGWESRVFYDSRTFAEVELILTRDWAAHRGKSTLSWELARQAVRDSWNRIDHKYLIKKW